VAERRLLWIYAFSAFFVLVEPAPVDFFSSSSRPPSCLRA
jgi:hypothetical protein